MLRVVKGEGSKGRNVPACARELATVKTAKGTPYAVATQRTSLMAVQCFFRFLLAGAPMDDQTKEVRLLRKQATAPDP